MRMLLSEYTIVELCQELKVTPSWVNKAIRDLELPREGRGRLRKYTRDEAVILRNAKRLFNLGFPLTFLRDLRKSEGRTRETIQRVVESTLQQSREGKVKSIGGFQYIVFMLQPLLKIPFEGIIEQVNGREVESDVLDTFLGFERAYLDEIMAGLDRYLSDMSEFKRELSVMYRPLQLEE